jgi:putative endonuclease
MPKEGYVYFMTNSNNRVLYIGVTNDLVRRMAEHKAKINPSFTSKYNCYKLVYFEEFENITNAIEREKQLKKWKRQWKNVLVNFDNPNWEDLSEEIGLDTEFVDSVRQHYIDRNLKHLDSFRYDKY